MYNILYYNNFSFYYCNNINNEYLLDKIYNKFKYYYKKYFITYEYLK